MCECVLEGVRREEKAWPCSGSKMDLGKPFAVTPEVWMAGAMEKRVACPLEERSARQRGPRAEKRPVALQCLYLVKSTSTLCFQRSLSALRRGGSC